MNGIVAALAGAVKDATDETAGPPVQSPIFAHPHFEHLEAAGLAAQPAQVRAALDLLRKPALG